MSGILHYKKVIKWCSKATFMFVGCSVHEMYVISKHTHMVLQYAAQAICWIIWFKLKSAWYMLIAVQQYSYLCQFFLKLYLFRRTAYALKRNRVSSTRFLIRL